MLGHISVQHCKIWQDATLNKAVMLWPCVTGDGPASFVDLMNLEEINETTYRSTTAAFAPGGALLQAVRVEKKRTYGGHVYAQAVWAAAQTLEGKGFICHVCMYSLEYRCELKKA